ncbi:MAG TPA: endonuclease/exonuclease/phosphatase family protein, partial [Acidimicrobiales bacterium]|nr:endonuclease/exonuclease/phosphatase family protein [Acidimicrobiales bacterium]
MPRLVVATFNVHGGVDGWGRAYDVVDACRRLEADVLVLQESWTPAEGPALADTVAAALGYEVAGRAMAPVVLYPPDDRDRRGWGPPRWPRRSAGIRAGHRSGRGAAVVRGTVGLAMLWRVAARPPEVIELGRIGTDPARRLAFSLEVGRGPAPARPALTVVGTHMSHIRHGSPVQLRRLHRVLPPPHVPAVLVGD